MDYPKSGIKWSEDETILAFRLYCQIPYSKIGNKLPSVIALSELLGRSPSSVALKMQNLAHFDPELRQRHVKGMEHASKTDELVFQRFSSDWESLIYEANLIEAKLKNLSSHIPSNIDSLVLELPEGNVKEQLVRQRINQNFFRQCVLSSYHQSCCITGINDPSLLVASHIKPWAVSDPQTERTNPQNGLCLNALHDKAFDRGLMTILPDYTIRFSSRLKNKSDNDGIAWLMQCDKQSIKMPEKFLPSKKFLEYHNDVIFIP